jgi:spore germination protein YaaH
MVTDPSREDLLRHARRRIATTLIAVLLLASFVIPVSAAVPGPAAVPVPTSATAQATTRGAPDGPPQANASDTAGLHPSIHWEEAQAHANDKLDLPAGGRVTIAFKPRSHDHWAVGGAAPRALPAGRLSGRQLRDAAKLSSGTPTPVAPAASEPPPATEPAPPADPAPSADPGASAPTVDPAVDQPIIDDSQRIPADGASWTMTGADPAAELTAPIAPGYLKKEVFGFLPYWELSDSSTTLDYAKISTIAYFGVGASATGTFENTPGYTGWTSAALTNVINAAHQNRTRVVLTVQSFAWSAGGVTKQKALLGSSTARVTLAKNIAKAIRDRGVDGVNLDFEPIVSGYDDEFVLLVKRVRTELDAVAKGYQLTFDTTGYIGNYPLEAATAAGAADAIFVMGYDYRSAGSSPVGSIAPIAGPAYDITDTVLAYTARVPASKVILGVPYYGRAWSTDTDLLHATNTSGTKYGASTTVVYGTGIGVLQANGKRYDTGEGVAWTAYQLENCSSTYGCVTGWRQLYLDDATALRAKYDIVNRYGLRGAGIWALGYDGARPELYAALDDKFVNATPFTDLRQFITQIEWLYTSGITGGCTPTKFCPTATVSRAQMAMFLTRALNLPAATIDYFNDDNGKTGESSINALARAGITGGCAPHKFCPAASVSRAEMAMFLDRALDLPNTATNYFDDDNGRTGEASINALALSGITGGCATRRYCPTASVTREQMAAFLYRAHVQGRLP